MGIRTHLAVVPFKITVPTEDYETEHKLLRKFLDCRDETILAGWSYQIDEVEEIGEIFFQVLHKGKSTVFAINESDFLCGGGSLVQSFAARSKKTLERFCKDWGFNADDIERNAPVKWTV